jgi:hypothetical protein
MMSSGTPCIVQKFLSRSKKRFTYFTQQPRCEPNNRRKMETSTSAPSPATTEPALEATTELEPIEDEEEKSSEDILEDEETHGEETESHHDEISHEQEFQLPHPVNPLGGRSYQIPETPHEQWNFNLGMVANLASTQIHKVTAAAGSILPMNLYRRKSFSLTFQSKNIPFEFTTNIEGYVVVSHVTKSVDTRLHRGVVVLAVNDSLVNLHHNASEEMEKLLENAQVPFSITFEEINEESDGDPDYEEESTKTDSSVEDDQEHHHIVPKEQHDDSEPFPHKSDATNNRNSLASVASSSANLLSSSLFSLTSKMRAFVTPAEQHGASAAAAVAPSVPPPPPHAEEYHQIPDNCFELILSARSPPFVFDLHADGHSIVVVKIIGDKKSMDPRLQEGCVVRFVNDVEVKCRTRQEFDQLLGSIEATPLRLILEHAPALYRHQDALSLYTTGQHEQAVHVFTVMPNSFSFHAPTHHNPQQMSVTYDDVYHTSQRALQVLQAFRAQGISVELISMETVLVGTNSAYAGLLNTSPLPLHSDSQSSAAALSNSIVNNLASILPTHAPLLRGIRVWFRFPDALQITVQQPMNFVGSLEVTRNGENGTWIVIRCIVAQSPWIEEGMILGRPYLVTQVNGYDTSASGYRSINARIPGSGDWESSILPFFNLEEIHLTIV